jgi:hypothetical protein
VALRILKGVSPSILEESLLQVPSCLHKLEPRNPMPPSCEPDYVAFVWQPPDLSYGSLWYKARARDLLATCLCYKDPGPLIEEGLDQLRIHRGNYDYDGPAPTRLQLLWWMFPKEHWNELQEGCSMNFLVKPRNELTSNSELDEEQIVIAE